MKVLIGCEFSGIVRDAFMAKGHDAVSCDLLPTEKPGNHIQDDILKIIDDGWDLGIFHTPCTYSCLSGITWLYNKDGSIDTDRWSMLEYYAGMLRECLNSKIPKVCCENPIPHRHAVKIIGRKYDQIIHPWQFGHMEQKSTCLWLKGLPHLQPSKNVYDEMMMLPKRERERLHYLPPSKDRWKERSKTFPGIAQAMAEQWG